MQYKSNVIVKSIITKLKTRHFVLCKLVQKRLDIKIENHYGMSVLDQFSFVTHLKKKKKRFCFQLIKIKNSNKDLFIFLGSCN